MFELPERCGGEVVRATLQLSGAGLPTITRTVLLPAQPACSSGLPWFWVILVASVILAGGLAASCYHWAQQADRVFSIQPES